MHQRCNDNGCCYNGQRLGGWWHRRVAFLVLVPHGDNYDHGQDLQGGIKQLEEDAVYLTNLVGNMKDDLREMKCLPSWCSRHRPWLGGGMGYWARYSWWCWSYACFSQPHPSLPWHMGGIIPNDDDPSHRCDLLTSLSYIGHWQEDQLPENNFQVVDQQPSTGCLHKPDQWTMGHLLHWGLLWSSMATWPDVYHWDTMPPPSIHALAFIEHLKHLNSDQCSTGWQHARWMTQHLL